MSNRYSRTGFTQRQDDTLASLQRHLLRIVKDRSGKQDNERALQLLFKAQDAISQARYLSKEWKK